MSHIANFTPPCPETGINTIGNIRRHQYTSTKNQQIGKSISCEKVASMCLVITVVSFLGFWVENIFIAITKGYIDNRNMLFPFLLGYGLAIAVIYLLFGTPKEPKFFGIELKSNNKVQNILTFLFITFLCVCVGECILGTFVEKTCGIVWWNYSNIPLHFTKYTSFPTSLGFALLITVFMEYFFTPIYNGFTKINKKTLYILATVFIVLLVGDFLFSAARMFNTLELMKIWRIEL